MQVWQRACPMCAAKLEKQTLAEPWRCECGWSTEDKSRVKVSRDSRSDSRRQ
jgi:hypothetical protein